MADTLPPELLDFRPCVDHIVTEDDTPVDNLFSEKQMRLLTEPLYSSWHPVFTFLVAANVGVFQAIRKPPVVPDVFLSLEVEVHPDWYAKEHRTYFVWEFGKVPDAVIEIVSNTVGGETDEKMKKYARMGIQYYAIYDPTLQVLEQPLQVYSLRDKAYQPHPAQWLPLIGLGLALWSGQFEGIQSTWLRWCDQEGHVIPTGAERAEQERQRAEQEHQRAEHELQRAERLAAQLRALGVKPQGNGADSPGAAGPEA
jgi:Uma2 family endonuclease